MTGHSPNPGLRIPERSDPVLRAEERLEALERAAHRLSTTTHSGSSSDGLATAEIDSDGTLRRLEIPASLVGLSPSRVGAAIVEAAGAAARAAQDSRESVFGTLADDLRRRR